MFGNAPIHSAGVLDYDISTDAEAFFPSSALPLPPCLVSCLKFV